MVSQTGRYALRILGYLADHRGQWIQGSQISSETGIPSNYLSKILNQLRKRRLVLSRKGWGGGFLLNAPYVKETLIEELRKSIKDFEIDIYPIEPVIGAYYLGFLKLSKRCES